MILPRFFSKFVRLRDGEWWKREPTRTVTSLGDALGPAGVVGAAGIVGPTGFVGPTGPVPINAWFESKGKPGTMAGVTGAQGPRFLGFRDGEWYAFRLYRLVDDEKARDRRVAEATARGGGIVRYPGKPLRDGLPFEKAQSGVDVVEFFAVATTDPTTGFLELREFPDPWLCAVCGESYQDGAHTEFGFAGLDAHDYVARGAPSEEPA